MFIPLYPPVRVETMKEQREPLLRVNISHFPPPFEPHCEGLARGLAPALPLAAGRGCGARGESCGAVQVTSRWWPEPAASRSRRFHGSGLTGPSPRAAAGGRGIGAGTFVCGVCPAPRCRQRRSSAVSAEAAGEEAEVRSRGRRRCGGRKPPLELFANPIRRVEERWGKGGGRKNTARAGPRADRYKGRRRRAGTHGHARTDAGTHAGEQARCLQPRRAARRRLAERDQASPPAIGAGALGR